MPLDYEVIFDIKIKVKKLQSIFLFSMNLNDIRRLLVISFVWKEMF